MLRTLANDVSAGSAAPRSGERRAPRGLVDAPSGRGGRPAVTRQVRDGPGLDVRARRPATR